jgi:hypothetical protein
VLVTAWAASGAKRTQPGKTGEINPTIVVLYRSSLIVVNPESKPVQASTLAQRAICEFAAMVTMGDFAGNPLTMREIP